MATDRPSRLSGEVELSGKDGKTEKPTPQRLRKAKREGQTPKSREVGTATSLLGGLFVLTALAPGAVATFRDRTAWLFTHTTGGDELPVGAIVDTASAMGVGLLVPFLGTAVVVGLAGGFAQVGFSPAPKAIKPEAKRLNPKRGLQRFKPSQVGWELVRNLVKLALLGVLLWVPLSAWMGEVAGRLTLEGGMAALGGTAGQLLARATVLAAVIAGADFAWTKRSHRKQLMMRTDEVKREHKDSDGDPLMKQKRRERAQELSANRMIASVGEADVVVTNPTHFAVALGYDASEAAPRVVAKGMDDAAREIAKEARRHGVPVVENRPLARGLYRRCRLGDYVPAALFEAVAAVLASAYRRRGRAAA